MKKKENILFVTITSFPYGESNDNLVRLFATGLAKNKRKVTVLQQNEQINQEGNFRGVEFKSCGIFNKATRLGNVITKLFLSILIPPFYILKNNKNIDLVINFNFYFHESFLILLICKILKIPIVHHQVDIYDWTQYKNMIKNPFTRVLKYLSYNLRYNFFNKFNDGIIVISHFIYNHFIDLKIEKSRLYILTHLVEIENFKAASIDQIFANNKITIGALGPLNEMNGISDILNAFTLVSNQTEHLELLLIGGPLDAIEKYKKKAENLGIIDKVSFPGEIHHTDLVNELKKCDIFVLARPVNVYAIAGFPTKLGEYVACHRPVIITNYGDIPLFLKHKENAMLINPNDTKSLQNNILFLINNQEKAKIIGENGFRWGLSKLEYIVETGRICNFLDSL